MAFSCKRVNPPICSPFGGSSSGLQSSASWVSAAANAVSSGSRKEHSEGQNKVIRSGKLCGNEEREKQKAQSNQGDAEQIKGNSLFSAFLIESGQLFLYSLVK